MIEHKVALFTAKVGQFLFVPFIRTDNLDQLWAGASKEASQTKALYMVFIENYEKYNIANVAKVLKENSEWLRDNAYLATPSNNLIVVNFRVCRKYGAPGHHGLDQFVDWLFNKVTSEGHRVSQLQPDEFPEDGEFVENVQLAEDFQPEYKEAFPEQYDEGTLDSEDIAPDAADDDEEEPEREPEEESITETPKKKRRKKSYPHK